MPVPKIARKTKRKASPQSSEADRPGPSRPKAWKRSEGSRPSSSRQCNGIREHRFPKRCQLQKARAANDERRAERISRGLATGGFDVHTSEITFSLLSTIVEDH